MIGYGKLTLVLLATFASVAAGGCASAESQGAGTVNVENALPLSSSACDRRYQDVCVPIATDVDCAGGNGNGPAYFRGPAPYQGTDPYGLDRDRDGILCEPNPER